jgi:hypothetical protein
MIRNFLSIKGGVMIVAAVAAILLAAGCGGGGGGNEQVTVHAGSLSKGEFIKRADSICAATRSRFTREYTAFLKPRLKNSSQVDQSALQSEVVKSVVIPIFTKDIDEISALGAPKGEEQKVSTFLNALQQRLDELNEQPSELSGTIFAKPAKLAQASGLSGCAESFG